MSEIEEVPVVRVDYRKLAMVCNYCKADPRVIRITHLLDGEILVSPLCSRHARGEQEACTKDLVNMPGTGTFVHPNIELLIENELSEVVGKPMSLKGIASVFEE